MKPSRMPYYLTHEQATVIRNLLHKEELEYRAINKPEGEFYRAIMSALNAMEHPEQCQPVKTE